MTIRDRIFHKLTELDMIQKEFAKRTGIPETTVSDWKKKNSIILNESSNFFTKS